MRDYWMRDPRNELARYMEDCCLSILHKTGEIPDLGLTLSDVVEGAKKMYENAPDNTKVHHPAVWENAFVCSKIDEAISRMNWGDE